jgi:small subunit ribosomal protein S19e
MPLSQQSGLQQSGITVKDVDAHEFVRRYATHLKKQGKIALPELVDLVKTSVGRELAPYDEDWFFVRCGESNTHTNMCSGGPRTPAWCHAHNQ